MPPIEDLNILCIMADDMGKAGLSFYPGFTSPTISASSLQTPNLDQFALTSRVFDNFVATPLCLPTRVAYATGKLPHHNQHYIYRTTRAPSCLVAPDSLYQKLRELGYVTGAFGKWHLTFNMTKCLDHPKQMGFDEYSVSAWADGKSAGDELLGRYWGAPFVEHSSPTVIETDKTTFAEDYTADRCIDFLRRYRNQKFYAQFWTSLPHPPFIATPDLQDLSATLSDHQKYAGMIAYMDKLVGRMLTELDQLNLAEKTLVLFFTDNGGPPPEGDKSMLSESGICVPLMCRLPSVIPPGREKRLLSVVDLYPTLLQMAGAEGATSQDGIAQMALLTGAEGTARQTVASMAFEGVWMVRDDRWKLQVPNRCRGKPNECAALEVIDLVNDPEEDSPIKWKKLTPGQRERASALLQVAKDLGLAMPLGF